MPPVTQKKKYTNSELVPVAKEFVDNPESLTHVKDPINVFIAIAESAAAEV